MAEGMAFEPGIYFDLPDTDYFAIPALSASGIKHLKISPLDFWARSWMAPDKEAVEAEQGDTEARMIGRAFHKRIVEGRDAFAQCYAPHLSKYEYKGVLDTAKELQGIIREHNENVDKPNRINLTGSKPELIERVLSINPNAMIWDVIVESYKAKNEGKFFLGFHLMNAIELAAAMIEKHPVLGKAFSGGAAEVSIVWFCDKIGVPCKARLDYLKPKAIVDLKTFANPQEKPIKIAVARELAQRKYHIPAAHYTEAAHHAAQHIKAGRVFGDCDPGLLKALAQDFDKTFLFVFQAKGIAPLAVGRTLPRESMIFRVGESEVETGKQTFRTYIEKFGTDPWVDDATIEAFDDSEIPPWAME